MTYGATTQLTGRPHPTLPDVNSGYVTLSTMDNILYKCSFVKHYFVNLRNNAGSEGSRHPGTKGEKQKIEGRSRKSEEKQEQGHGPRKADHADGVKGKQDGRGVLLYALRILNCPLIIITRGEI